jgi:hypothetical protein
VARDLSANHLKTDDGGNSDDGRRDPDSEHVAHGREPPHQPPGLALWGRINLSEDKVEHAVGVLVGVLVQPRPENASQVAIGAHCATSRGPGRASASRAERSPRIA